MDIFLIRGDDNSLHLSDFCSKVALHLLPKGSTPFVANLIKIHVACQ